MMLGPPSNFNQVTHLLDITDLVYVRQPIPIYAYRATESTPGLLF